MAVDGNKNADVNVMFPHGGTPSQDPPVAVARSINK